MSAARPGRLDAAPVASWPDAPDERVAPDRRWDLLLGCLALYLLTSVGRIHQLFAFLGPLHLALVSAVLAIAVYAISRGRARRLAPVLRARTTRLVLAIALWMGLSIPGALWPGGAFKLFSDEFVKTVVMFVVLVGAVRGVRDVERLAFVYVLSAGIYAGVVLARFDVGGAQWRLGSLYYYDANEFATLAVMSLPLGVYFAVRPRSPWRRLAGGLAAGALAVAIVRTGSRGGFLALVAVAGFLLLRYTAIHARWRILATALFALVFAAAASDTYWDKMKTIVRPQEDYNITGAEGRLQVWKRGLGYMARHPVLGVGAGNFPTAEGTLSPLARAATRGRGVKWSAAHNSYLQIGAELGAPGLVLFLLMLGTALGALQAVQRHAIGLPGGASPPAAQLAQALTGALIGYLVGAFFLSLAYHDLLYVLVALIAALRKVSRLAPTPSASR